MSTSFHRLDRPTTSLRVTEDAGRARISVWTDHEMSGTLTVAAGNASRVCLALARTEQAVERVGADGGQVALVVADAAPDEDEQLVSDTGVLTTLRELREDTDVVRVLSRSEFAFEGRLTPAECERLMGFPDGWAEADGAVPRFMDTDDWRIPVTHDELVAMTDDPQPGR